MSNMEKEDLSEARKTVTEISLANVEKEIETEVPTQLANVEKQTNNPNTDTNISALVEQSVEKKTVPEIIDDTTTTIKDKEVLDIVEDAMQPPNRDSPQDSTVDPLQPVEDKVVSDMTVEATAGSTHSEQPIKNKSALVGASRDDAQQIEATLSKPIDNEEKGNEDSSGEGNEDSHLSETVTEEKGATSVVEDKSTSLEKEDSNAGSLPATSAMSDASKDSDDESIMENNQIDPDQQIEKTSDGTADAKILQRSIMLAPDVMEENSNMSTPGHGDDEDMEVDGNENEDSKDIGESQEESEQGEEESGGDEGAEGGSQSEQKAKVIKRRPRRRKGRRRVVRREDTTPDPNVEIVHCGHPGCDFKTKWKHNMYRHRNTHRGERPKPKIIVETNSSSPMPGLLDESSNMSTSSNRSMKKLRGDLSAMRKELEDFVGEDGKLFTHKLFEYQWPPDKNGEWFVLQEQISQFLNIKSFKRKYPNIYRRPVEMHERIFLREQKVVTETQCDLGLTVLRSEDVCDMMLADYPDKYQEFLEVMREREKERTLQKQKFDTVDPTDKGKMFFFRKRALKSAVSFNSHIMRELRDDRATYFDLQTFEVHYPRRRHFPIPSEATKTGAYPVSVIPGQFCDNYKNYNSEQLHLLPLNTVTRVASDPPPIEKPKPKDNEDAQSQSSSSDSDSSDSSGSSSSSDSDSSDSEEEESTQDTPTNTPTGRGNGTSTRGKSRGRGARAGGMKRVPSSLKRKGSSTPSSSAPGTPTSKSTCHICHGDEQRNSDKQKETMVKCGECNKHGHPSCLELTVEMIPIIKSYPWQCMECKTCVECMEPHDEDKMMFCDRCDRGYHTFCIGLKKIPNGRWECKTCTSQGDSKPGTPTRGRSKTPSVKGENDGSAGASPVAKVIDPNAPPVKRRGRPPKALAEKLAAERQRLAEERARERKRKWGTLDEAKEEMSSAEKKKKHGDDKDGDKSNEDKEDEDKVKEEGDEEIKQEKELDPEETHVDSPAQLTELAPVTDIPVVMDTEMLKSEQLGADPLDEEALLSSPITEMASFESEPPHNLSANIEPTPTLAEPTKDSIEVKDEQIPLEIDLQQPRNDVLSEEQIKVEAGEAT